MGMLINLTHCLNFSKYPKIALEWLSLTKREGHQTILYTVTGCLQVIWRTAVVIHIMLLVNLKNANT